MSTCLIAGALAPNNLNTQAPNSYYDSVQREFSQVMLNHLLALNATLILHNVELTSAVFIEGFNATLMKLGREESVLIIEQHDHRNEFYLVNNNFVADKLNLNHQYRFSNQSILTVDKDTGELRIKYYGALTKQTHFLFDGTTTALSVKATRNQIEEHNRLAGSHTLSFSNRPGKSVSTRDQFTHYMNTMEGRQISHWDTLPLNKPADKHEQALFIARTKYNRLEGELELFQRFMCTRDKLGKLARCQYDKQLELVHHQVQNAFWSLECSQSTDPSLQVIIAITLLEKFFHKPKQIQTLLHDIDACWQLIANINLVVRRSFPDSAAKKPTCCTRPLRLKQRKPPQRD